MQRLAVSGAVRTPIRVVKLQRFNKMDYVFVRLVLFIQEIFFQNPFDLRLAVSLFAM